MERILLAQESLKRAFKKEEEARVALREAENIRITFEMQLEEAKQQYLEDIKTSSIERKRACRIWYDSEGKQHKIEYLVV